MYFSAEEIGKGWYKRNHVLICKIDEIPNQFSICRKISEFLCSLSIISRQELRRATNCHMCYKLQVGRALLQRARFVDRQLTTTNSNKIFSKMTP